jgi:hypothetical protein
MNGVRLMALRLRHCRFIVDEAAGPDQTTYCGAETVPGSSWCPEHRAVCVTEVVRQAPIPGNRVRQR